MKLHLSDSLNQQPANKFSFESNQPKSISAMVANAATLLTPVWPLETFIACNSLHGYESLNFEEAVLESQLNKNAQVEPKLEEVNRQMIKWCSAFLDSGQSAITMPNKEKGFYAAFISLALYDSTLHQKNKTNKSWLVSLPHNAEQAIIYCFKQLGIPSCEQEKFIERTLCYLPGWAGYIKWMGEWSSRSSRFSSNLVDFLAIRLVITCLLWPEAGKKTSHENQSSLSAEFLKEMKAKERWFRNDLLIKILYDLKTSKKDMARPDAQLVFCIDVRSEPFRRAIEKQGCYETLGFAGFFGLPIKTCDVDTGKDKELCPVLLKPKFTIDETPVDSQLSCVTRHKQGKKIKNTLSNVYYQLKYNFSTPFALAEFLGAWCGLTMFMKSCSPIMYTHLTNWVNELIAPSLRTKPVFDPDPSKPNRGIAKEEQLSYAEAILRLMGLTKNFAKVVLLCGHGSTTQNNPYASALDCGACGGNPGSTNAKLLATLLNKADIRTGLAEKGIIIPSDTVFYAALHNTTTDEITLYTDQKKPMNQAILRKLKIAFADARKETNIERKAKLAKSASKADDIVRRSSDWSEVRPEWGLARNAAFIVGPRSLTENINLDGRCFLHSYDWQEDTHGSCLETILTAPMVVAQWINNQYLFSTLDNIAYGSGSKITQNVTGKIGIMQGNGSDLMHGLPLQSVKSDDRTNYHEPLRLLTIVYAPKHLVTQIIDKHEILKKLFFNHWVSLVVIDPTARSTYSLNEKNTWEVI
ncbi:DUF2309 domain-containing protein [Legionella micdadei]|uniref:DUF2309 domain-containing protein n=1 Tax=Legionella micdadei TaxID=451 RepID=UPI0009EF7AB4|nr:DUF2309 domain-containing protein [Legionella micdadei]ARH00712.1 hypothetical protein B6V88_09955 [Legionella micdadei]